ncbi:hypothetical protein EJ02DRAFT_67404 [Clathrospora elynae]|uniref:Uncharacterized protein n=1 Tax=Clathrospora elynae TaxID=706981 RepID=A0A6A5SWP3_9PLEO|nr:hypothetical protein EJ02DRAFT_67404 [Clathrospora elynae]
MIDPSSLVLYRPGSSSFLTTKSYSTSLISSRFYTQQTGTAIATELLYRILIDIINRLLASFQRLASRGMEECSSWMERRMQERHERLEAAKHNGIEGLKIVEEVGRLAQEREFITCPMMGRVMDARMEGKRGPPGPPKWVRGVLGGIEEGIMLDRDFWIQTHCD